MAFRKLAPLVALLACLALLLGCGAGPVAGNNPPASQPSSDIDAFLARYVLATKERDADALAGMYTDPVEWTDVTGTYTYTRTEVKAMFETVYSVVSIVYDSYMKDVNVAVSGDAAVVRFVGVQDVHNAVLDQRVVGEVPTTWTLRKIEGTWYIAKSSS